VSDAAGMILATLLALLVCLLGTAPLRGWLIAKGLVDQPGPRRSHCAATPRGGGLAVLVAWLIGTVVGALLVREDYATVAVVVLSSTLMALLGWRDDLRALGVGVRLAGQVLLVIGLLWWLGGVPQLSLGQHTLASPWLWNLLAVPAAVWLINAHNFMDGSDGLAATQAIWSACAYAVVFGAVDLPEMVLPAAVLAASCLGFLWWNRPRARIFLGDSGSLLIGAAMACFALVGAVSGKVSIWLSLLISALFAVDATVTLLARLLCGKRWYTAHRNHAFQRLLTMGWSHAQVLALYLALNVLVVLPAILGARLRPDLDFVIALAVVTLLTLGWLGVQVAAKGEQPPHD